MLISLDGNGPKSHDKLTSLAAHAAADRIFPFFRLLMIHQNLTSGAEEKTRSRLPQPNNQGRISQVRKTECPFFYLIT